MKTFGFTLLRRDWRSGDLRLMLAAIAVAVAVVSAVTLFSDRLQSALVAKSNQFLAAELVVSSSKPVSALYADTASQLSIQQAEKIEFSSMIFFGDAMRLSSIQAVSDSYPLLGEIEVSNTPYGALTKVSSGPADGELWIDARLSLAVGAQIDDTVELGNTQLKVTRILVREPDQKSAFSVAPRAMMNVANVEAAGVIRPGSRVRYRALYAGDNIGDFKAQVEPLLTEHESIVDIDTQSPAIGESLGRAERFLLLASCLGVLLAAIAISVAARRYSERKTDSVAVMKTLGFSGGSIVRLWATQILCVGFAGSLIGIAIGGAVQAMVFAMLAKLFVVDIPAPSWQPFALSLALGLSCALFFVMPSVIALKKVSPMRVLNREHEAHSKNTVRYWVAAIALLIGLRLFAGSWQMAVALVMGIAAVAVGVAGLLAIVRWVISKFKLHASTPQGLATANLLRNRVSTWVQVSVFSMATLIVAVIVLLRGSLIEEWRNQLPTDAPNHFLYNIAPELVEPVQQHANDSGWQGSQLFPLVRARISMLNGVAMKEALDEATQNRIDREYNISYTLELPKANNIVDGEWLSEASSGEISLEKELAKTLGLKVGDSMGFSVGGYLVETKITSLREVDWNQMRPNFFVIANPGVFPEEVATYMAAYRLEAGKSSSLNQLLLDHPTISLIEVDTIIRQIREIIDQVSSAVELVMVLIFASAILVLLACVELTVDQRLKDGAILRTLGASKLLLRRSQVIEFAIIGASSALIAILVSEAVVAYIQTQIFELNWQVHEELLAVLPLVTSMVVLAGWWSTRSVAKVAPMRVLHRH